MFMYINTTKAVIETSNRTTKKNKKRMTQEILVLMNQRRETKSHTEKYKELVRTIKRKIKDIYESWNREQYEEIKNYENRHDTFNM